MTVDFPVTEHPFNAVVFLTEYLENVMHFPDDEYLGQGIFSFFFKNEQDSPRLMVITRPEVHNTF
jgi:hypothetical protein